MKIVKGGQGRRAEEVRADAAAVGLCLIAFVIVAFLAVVK